LARVQGKSLQKQNLLAKRLGFVHKDANLASAQLDDILVPAFYQSLN